MNSQEPQRIPNASPFEDFVEELEQDPAIAQLLDEAREELAQLVRCPGGELLALLISAAGAAIRESRTVAPQPTDSEGGGA